MIYSYNQLRGKIKVGDKVRAVQGYYNPCHTLDDSAERKITEVTDELFFIYGCPHDFNEDAIYLEIIETNQPTMNNEHEEITWETLKAGDYIKYKHGQICKILARIDDLIAVSYSSNHDDMNAWWSTNAVKKDYTIVQPTKQPRKVTLAEIAEKFGEEVEVVG